MHSKLRFEERVIFAGLLLITLFYWANLSTYFALGVGDVPGWWSWFDQSMYLRPAKQIYEQGSTNAWHYQPLYSLASLAFSWLNDAIRLVKVPHSDHAEVGFYWLDYVCLIASAVLFHNIAKKIGVPYGILIFFGLAFLYPPWFESFVIPWTSTFTVPLIYGAYLLVLSKERTLARFIILVLLAWAIVLSRPSDLFAIIPAAILFCWGMTREFGYLKTALACLLASIFGLLSLLGWGWIAGSGPLGPYFNMAQSNGLTFSSLLYKFVVIMFDSRDYDIFANSFREHNYLLYVIVLGGLILPLIRRDTMLWIGLSCWSLFVVALIFNDLHPSNLFHFKLTHYIKFMIPICLLFWVREFIQNRRRAAIMGAVVVAASFIGLYRSPTDLTCRTLDDQRYECSGIDNIKVMTLALNKKAYHPTYYGHHVISIDGVEYKALKDFRIFIRGNMLANIIFHKPVSGTAISFSLTDDLKVKSIEKAFQTFP